MRYRMVSEQSKRRFEQWLRSCPDPEYLSPQRSAGAFDAAKEDEPELVFDPRFLNAKVGDIIELDDGHIIEVVPDDDDEAPKPRIPVARPRRGNGHAFP
jgi:hypothetical protein